MRLPPKSPRKNQMLLRKNPSKKVKPKKEDFAEEFGQRRERRQTKQKDSRMSETGKKGKDRKFKGREILREEPEAPLLNPAASYLPVRKIENGIIYTKDHRFVKIIEVVPINFLPAPQGSGKDHLLLCQLLKDQSREAPVQSPDKACRH